MFHLTQIIYIFIIYFLINLRSWTKNGVAFVTSCIRVGKNQYLMGGLIAPFNYIHTGSFGPGEEEALMNATTFIIKSLLNNMSWVDIIKQAETLGWYIDTMAISQCIQTAAKIAAESGKEVVTESTKGVLTKSAAHAVETSIQTITETVVEKTVETLPSMLPDNLYSLVLLGGVFVIYMGLAELRNRFYPELAPKTSDMVSGQTPVDNTLYSVLEPSYNMNIILYFIGWSLLLIILYKLVDHYLIKLSIKTFIIILLPLFILEVLVVVYPTFSILIMVSFCSITLLTSFNYEIFAGFQKSKLTALKKLLDLFSYIGIIDLCSIVYILFFCVSRKRNLVFVSVFFFFNSLYILVSRYHFIVNRMSIGSVTVLTQPLFLYSLLFLGLMFLYLRLFILFSSSIVLATRHYSPNLLHPHVLYVFGETEGGTGTTPPSPPTPPTTIPPVAERRYSFINTTTTKNYYRNYYSHAAQNAVRWRNAGIAASFLGLGVGIATAKFSYDAAVAARQQVEIARQQVEIAHEQVRAQEANNYEMTVQNSLEAYSQNLMTKEQFLARHPEFQQPMPPIDDTKK